MGGESGPQGRRAIADPERRPLILRSSFSCAQPTEDRFQGHKMNIDLDSWEAGYAHGQQTSTAMRGWSRPGVVFERFLPW